MNLIEFNGKKINELAIIYFTESVFTIVFKYSHNCHKIVLNGILSIFPLLQFYPEKDLIIAANSVSL